MIMILSLFMVGMIFLPGCKKETKIYVPISLTDKEGNVFIQIDTILNSFDAYSTTRISKGLLKGIFNDTIRSSFYLAITTDPYWDTVYHARDTIMFPYHYPSHAVSMETEIDLKDFTSPYHFILMGIPQTSLKRNAHGSPSIILMVDTRNE